MTNRKISGFTYLELIITISILSIMLAVTVPMMGIGDKYKINQSIQEFIDDCSTLRVLAISSGHVHGISINSDGKGYYIFKVLDRKEYVIEEKEFCSGLIISDTNILDRKIEFTSFGRPHNIDGSTTAGTIYFQFKLSPIKRITIEPILGRICVYDE